MLNISNLTVHYRDRADPILHSIHLELDEGDFCVIIGNNGSGKSTLIRTILGETVGFEGSINVNSNKEIASVTQDVNAGTIGELTLLENMVLTIKRNQRAHLQFYRKLRQKMADTLECIDHKLSRYMDKPLQNFSGGQRQMIATLMAIESQPKLLLLDEHTSALDPNIQNSLMEYTATAIEQHRITTLMVTHKLADAIQYGNRLIMLQNGRIIFSVSGAAKSALKLADLQALFYSQEMGDA